MQAGAFKNDPDIDEIVRDAYRAAAEFDRLRAHKKLKKIGRADLLIASIAPFTGRRW
jgi:hypothetical protein